MRALWDAIALTALMAVILYGLPLVAAAVGVEQ